MTRNLPLPVEHGTNDQLSAARTELLAVPDDPEDVEEITFLPVAATGDCRTTTWLTGDADDVVALQEMR